MGYERKLYVVSEKTWGDNPIDNWAEVLAMIDVCKCDTLYGVKWKDANATMFDTDGNTKITKDRYDESIKSAEPEDVVKVLDDTYKESHYWRAKSASNLIKDIVKNCDTRDNLKVYSYGY